MLEDQSLELGRRNLIPLDLDEFLHDTLRSARRSARFAFSAARSQESVLTGPFQSTHLDPIDDEEAATVIDVCDVARAEPAVGCQRRGCGARVAPVALHDVGAAGPDLAAVAGAQDLGRAVRVH